MLEGFAPGRALLDGTVLGSAFVLFVLATLRIQPRIWIGDLPADVRAVLPPLAPGERRIQIIAGILLFALLIGGLVVSACRLRADMGAVAFPAAVAHVWIVFAVVLIADTFVLDWLILSIARPRFAVIPGTEPYLDRILRLERFLRDMWRGFALALVVAAVIGFAVSR